jgi:hypothetical protein
VPNFDAQWRAPDGHEIVFTEQGTSTHGGGLDAVHPDGSGFRQILPPPDHDFYQGLELAPDGKTATYWTTDAPSATGADGHAHVHVVDLETGVDHRIVFGSPDADEAEFTHSPDGTAGLLVRTEAGASTVLLVQLVGSAPPRSLSERFLPTGEKTAFFSPDGRTAIIHFDTTRPRFVDIATGVTRTADAPVGRIGGWQRLPLTP